MDDDPDHTWLWLVVALVLSLLTVMAWGGGSELSDLQRRVGHLEVQCNTQK